MGRIAYRMAFNVDSLSTVSGWGDLSLSKWSPNSPFWIIDVINDRRLMIDDGWCGSNDSNTGMTGKLFWLVGKVEKLDVERFVGGNLSDAIGKVTRTCLLGVRMVFDREKTINCG